MLEGRHQEALAFNAPFVIDRLVKDRVADTPAFAEHLFTEIKRYLVLCDASADTKFAMCSAMVDEAWHAFILFTTEYTEYGRRFFGNYVHHSPAANHEAAEPTTVGDPNLNEASFNDFRQRYEELYGQPLPAVWYDDSSVAPTRRVINASAGKLTYFVDDHTVRLQDERGNTVLSVDELACEAVDFIARTPDFYVRELPGELTEDEKAGVIAPLVRLGVLRLAP